MDHRWVGVLYKILHVMNIVISSLKNCVSNNSDSFEKLFTQFLILIKKHIILSIYVYSVWIKVKMGCLKYQFFVN